LSEKQKMFRLGSAWICHRLHPERSRGHSRQPNCH